MDGAESDEEREKHGHADDMYQGNHDDGRSETSSKGVRLICPWITNRWACRISSQTPGSAASIGYPKCRRGPEGFCAIDLWGRDPGGTMHIIRGLAGGCARHQRTFH